MKNPLASLCRPRRTPMSGFGAAFADRCAWLRPEHWDEVTRDASLFMSRRYAEALDSSGHENIQARYALVYRDGQPVAALAVQLVDVLASRLRGAELDGGRKVEGRRAAAARLIRRAAGAAKRRTIDRIEARLLVCGNVLSTGSHGIAFARGVDEREVWPAVIEVIARLRRGSKHTGQSDFVMIKDFDAGSPSSRLTEEFGFGAFETEPNMVLEIKPEWTDYERYVGALAGKYKKDVQRQDRRLQEAGCAVERLRGLAAYRERLHELYMKVHARAAMRLVTATPDYLPLLERTLGEDFRCTVIRRGEDILGFVTNLRDGDLSHGYLIGYDREAHSDLPLYFRLLQASIAVSVEWGARRLSLGRTALEPKARLGARQVPLEVRMRHRLSPLNALVRPLLRMIPHDIAPERHPFAEDRAPTPG